MMCFLLTVMACLLGTSASYSLGPAMCRPSTPTTVNMFIEPHFVTPHRQVVYAPRTFTSPCTPHQKWCQADLRRLVALRVTLWLLVARRMSIDLLACALQRLDPSKRLPKPKPAPLSLLAQSVGKETLIENKGRRATIRSKAHKRHVLKRSYLSGWDALEGGIF